MGLRNVLTSQGSARKLAGPSKNLLPQMAIAAQNVLAPAARPGMKPEF